MMSRGLTNPDMEAFADLDLRGRLSRRGAPLGIRTIGPSAARQNDTRECAYMPPNRMLRR